MTIEVQYDTNGLIPAIVQHHRTGSLLMVGYMNAAALAATLSTHQVTFWSRSRQALWRKGETSGNVLELVEVRVDCDGDALLILANPHGPTCHTGATSCFYRLLDGSPVSQQVPAVGFLAELADLVAERAANGPPESYTAKLLAGGVDRIGKKIGEEAAEVIIAAKNANPAELTWEVADLLYHSLVLLQQQGVALEAIWAELQRRHHAPRRDS